MGAIISIAEGIGAAATANTNAQETTGLQAIMLVMTYLPLQQAWSKTLSEDAENIYIANMEVPGDPSKTAYVAEMQQKRNIDSSASDRETGNINTLIQGEKAQAQIGANAMKAAFQMVEPASELLQTLTNTIQKMG